MRTEATTPSSESLTSTPLTVASPSTHASAESTPSIKRCVRGPTRGKGVRKDKFKIIENEDECTELVEKVFHEKANLLYKDWKWRMGQHYAKAKKDGKDPYQRLFEGTNLDGWKYMIDPVFNDSKREPRKDADKKNREKVPYGHTTGSQSFRAAMTIAVRHFAQIIMQSHIEVLVLVDRYNENEEKGISNDGRKIPDFCDLYEASHLLRDTNEWIDPLCKEKHARMVAIRDEVALSGTTLSAEELSRDSLREAKTENYIRGLGNGPKPLTYFSKSKSPLACQDQLQKLQCELNLIHEERSREREDEKMRREEEQKQCEEEQRRHEEEREKDKRW